jgi:hypothetical protein
VFQITPFPVALRVGQLVRSFWKQVGRWFLLTKRAGLLAMISWQRSKPNQTNPQQINQGNQVPDLFAVGLLFTKKIY